MIVEPFPTRPFILLLCATHIRHFVLARTNDMTRQASHSRNRQPTIVVSQVHHGEKRFPASRWTFRDLSIRPNVLGYEQVFPYSAWLSRWSNPQAPSNANVRAPSFIPCLGEDTRRRQGGNLQCEIAKHDVRVLGKLEKSHFHEVCLRAATTLTQHLMKALIIA